MEPTTIAIMPLTTVDKEVYEKALAYATAHGQNFDRFLSTILTEWVEMTEEEEARGREGKNPEGFVEY